jgi:DNA (cytosine-5)-methyltransferase 1
MAGLSLNVARNHWITCSQWLRSCFVRVIIPVDLQYSGKLMDQHSAWRFYEFFAGGGMARVGLGEAWRCVFANDIDPKKAASYRQNFGARELRVDDVAAITTKSLPEEADLAWASFPCQDLSLAGAGAGLRGERSGTFWFFWRLMKTIARERRPVPIIVLENVCGALSAHGSADFAAIGSAIADAGYHFGALVIDAVDFVPQSRSRLFLVAMRNGFAAPRTLTSPSSIEKWHPPALISAWRKLPPIAAERWLWLKLPEPPQRRLVFSDLIEEEPRGVNWHTQAETERILAMVSHGNLAKVRSSEAGDEAWRRSQSRHASCQVA